MKRSRCTAEQIISILKEQVARMVTVEVCRRHGISLATLYKSTGNFRELEVSDARKPRRPEEESARLKRLLADTMLDNTILKEIGAKPL